MNFIPIFSLLCISFSLSAMQTNKLYSIMPSMRHQLVHQNNGSIGSGSSLSHAHLQKELDNDHYSASDIDGYLKRMYSFSRCSADEVSQFSRLVLKSIELEGEHASTHYTFFHGTLTIKFILLRTLLEQKRRKEDFQDFFLLRNKGDVDHLSDCSSAHAYTLNNIKAMYASKKGLGRFDGDPRIKAGLLSVSTCVLGQAESPQNEDSISYLDKMTRCAPAALDQKIDACLKDYGIEDVPKSLRSFLHAPIGSMLAILIPKSLASLAYVSYPFGIPIGLPQSRLLTGEVPQPEFEEIIKEHTEYPLSKFFAQRDDFHQARILLHPRYFEENTGGIKMRLFVWEHENVIDDLHEKFSEVESLLK